MRVRRLPWLIVVAALFAAILSVSAAKPADAQGSFDQELIRLLNEHRRNNGLNEMVASSTLSSGARAWSRTMMNDHPGGFRHAPSSQLVGLGENIAWSQGWVGLEFGISWQRSKPLPSYCVSPMDYTTAEFVMCGWLDSPSHRSAIDNPSYRQIGSGTVTADTSNGWITYSTQRFSAAAPAVTPTPTPTPVVTPEEPGHSIAANDLGDYVIAAVKEDGRLWVRRSLSGGSTDWRQLGAGGWVSADVTIEPGGAAHIAGIKADGTLFTNRWSNNGSLDGWADHGSNWDTDTMPSIATNGSKTVLGAVTASGNLKTKVFNFSWSGATTHGASGWAHGDVDVADDGDIWIAGVKSDGRLFLRKHLGSKWSGFARQGQPNWSTDTPPAVAAHSGGVVFGAVKADGRLYTRSQNNGNWSSFKAHGAKGWASVDVAITEQRETLLAAHKTWGRLYTRSQAASGTWSGWAQHGADTWSSHADASVTFGANDRGMIASVKESGALYTRSENNSSWGNWAGVGANDWATGR